MFWLQDWIVKKRSNASLVSGPFGCFCWSRNMLNLQKLIFWGSLSWTVLAGIFQALCQRHWSVTPPVGIFSPRSVGAMPGFTESLRFFQRRFFGWYMELKFRLMVYICRFNIIYSYFLSLYVYISLLIYIYLDIDYICEIIVAISRVGLGNMVMMGCVCPGLQPQTRQIWRKESIMQSVYLWNIMIYSKTCYMISPEKLWKRH